MRCIKCDYPLWNLDTPRCPECGAGFTLRHYRFRPYSVLFVCPLCGHEHVGAGPQYLPRLRGDRCKGCGRTIDPFAMRVAAMSGDPGAIDAVYMRPVPWEDRSIGLWRRWWDTFVMSVRRPRELAELITGVNGAGAALMYAVVAHGLAFALAALAGLVVFITDGHLAPARPFDSSLVFAFAIAVTFAVVGSVTWTMCAIPLWTMIADGLLRLGGCRRGGFDITMAALSYAQGSVVLGGAVLVPLALLYGVVAIADPAPSAMGRLIAPVVVNLDVALVQTAVIAHAVYLVSRTHRVSRLAAAGAVIAAPAALACVAGIAWVTERLWWLW
jgi:predicted RNA-binding Zn-ribbon protein involved in translation (DUF1610 family)